jgi:hypothetical protein
MVVEVGIIDANVDEWEEPHIQSSADDHWQFRNAGSNIVPAGQRSKGSLPSQQLKYPRQSMFPGQPAGAIVRPFFCLSAQKEPDTGHVAGLVVVGVELRGSIVDEAAEVDSVVVRGEDKILLVVVGKGVTERHCHSNKEDHWHILSTAANIVPATQKSIGSSPCQQLK